MKRFKLSMSARARPGCVRAELRCARDSCAPRVCVRAHTHQHTGTSVVSAGRRSSLGPRWGICGSPTDLDPRTNGDCKHRSPHKTRQPWVPTTSFCFCVRGATKPNCQPLPLSHLESDGGPTASMPAATRPHCILFCQKL